MLALFRSRRRARFCPQPIIVHWPGRTSWPSWYRAVIATLAMLVGLFWGHAPLYAQTVPQLKSLSLTPTIVCGEETIAGTVTLSAAAPASGVAVPLASSDPTATVPSSVTVASGQTTGTFTVRTRTVSAATPCIVAASLRAMVQRASLTVLPAGARPAIRQGGKASFRRRSAETMGSGPSWDIVRTGNTIATNTKPAGWTVAFDAAGRIFTVQAPLAAVVATDYRVRYTADGARHLAAFDIVPMNGAVFGGVLPAWAEDVRPMDGAPVSGAGPSSAGAVDLATGALENSPGPDSVVRNPVGPDAVYARMYRSERATDGYGSPGLSPGWVDNYDVCVQNAGDAGAWGALQLRYPNGSGEIWTPMLDGEGVPTGALTPPTGTPYMIHGTPTKTPGRWSALVMTLKDESTWTFLPDTANPDRYLLRRMTNLLGRSLVVQYDARNQNRLAAVTDDRTPANALLTFAYDAAGNLRTVRDIYGRQIQYTFEAASAGAGTSTGGARYLVSVSRPYVAGMSPALQWQYTYATVNGVPLLSTVGVPSPDGRSGMKSHPAIGYDLFGRVTAQVDANGNQRLYHYSSGQTHVQVKDAGNKIVEEWTQKISGGHVDSGTIDVDKHTTATDFGDPANPYSPTRATNENGQSGSATYDPYGNVLTATDSRGLTTVYTYDYTAFPMGRLVQVQTGTKTPTKFFYYPNGLLHYIATPHPNGVGIHDWVYTSVTYTNLGNIASITAPTSLACTITYTFNYTSDPTLGTRKTEALGEPLTVTDPWNRTTHFLYDGRGNVTTSIDPVTHRYDYAYDYADELTDVLFPTKERPGTGRVRVHHAYLYVGGPLLCTSLYDETGALVRQTSATLGSEGELQKSNLGNIARSAMSFDGQYRPGKLQDGKSQSSQFAYDRVGNVTGMTYPRGDRVLFPKYDAAGNILQRRDARQTLMQLTRAADDSRVTDVSYSDSTPGVHLEHDIYGRVKQVTDGAGTTSYTYDDNDAVLTKTVTYKSPATGAPLPAQQYTFTYYDDGRRKSMSAPTGLHTYSYAYGDLTHVNFPWDSVRYVYNDDHSLSSQTTSDVQSICYTYNGWSLPTWIVNTVLYSWLRTDISSTSNITYSTLGQRTGADYWVPSFTDGSATCPSTSGHVSYRYDAVGHLIEEISARANSAAIMGTYDFGHTWDGADNPVVFRNAGLSYNANNQLASATFDANGNELLGAGCVFDAENRLIAIGNSWAAGYGADGLRAWKYVAGSGGDGFTYYLYDGSLLIGEMDSAGTIQRSYGWGPTGLVQELVRGCAPVTLLYDLQGNLMQRVSHSLVPYVSMPVDTWLYDAFGKLQGSVVGESAYYAPTNEHVGFAGQWGGYTDVETGLVLMGHRYCVPGQGRFLTRDPIGYDGGLNLYAYCAGDPVNNADPSGLDDSHGDQRLRILGGFLAGALGERYGGSIGGAVGFGAFEGLYSFAEGNSAQQSVKHGALSAATSWGLGKLSGAALKWFGRTSVGQAVNRGASRVGAWIVARLRPGCFVAGTLVPIAAAATPRQDSQATSERVAYIPIENVKTGAYVLSRDPKTGKTSLKRVLRTTKRQVPKVVTLELSDQRKRAVTETIIATADHPFYVRGKGFVPAGRLAIGTAIVTRAGPDLIVKTVTSHARPQGWTVYNFEVQDNHTYFVGNAEGGVWVHNDCPLIVITRMHTLAFDSSDWRKATFAQDGLVYVLRDANNGELLKVGQTTARKFIGRFEKYITAGLRTNRTLVLDVFETPLAQRGQIEGQIRRHLGARPGSLPWDNTGRRLGRPGPGIIY